MERIDKRELIERAREDIARTVSVLTRAAHEAREAATHEESKPENDKDTRAVEAAYLAGAQAERVRDLERASAALAALDVRELGPDDAIRAGALVEIDQEGKRCLYFLAPEGGGLKVSVGARTVQIITPQSALGRELLGKAAGDDVEVTLQGKLRSYEILAVK